MQYVILRIHGSSNTRCEVCGTKADRKLSMRKYEKFLLLSHHTDYNVFLILVKRTAEAG